jgi:hypothetical protein
MIWAKDRNKTKYTFKTIDDLFEFINSRDDIIEGYAGG